MSVFLFVCSAFAPIWDLSHTDDMQCLRTPSGDRKCLRTAILRHLTNSHIYTELKLTILLKGVSLWNIYFLIALIHIGSCRWSACPPITCDDTKQVNCYLPTSKIETAVSLFLLWGESQSPQTSQRASRFVLIALKKLQDCLEKSKWIINLPLCSLGFI